MANQKCRYCGTLISGFSACSKSPTKYHVSVSNGTHCIYCGTFINHFYSDKLSPTSVTSFYSCKLSPTGIHNA